MLDIRSEEQILLFKELSNFYPDFIWKDEPQPGLRFHAANHGFGQSDGISLFFIFRYFQPKKVIEVGCGLSSALMLDINEKFFNQTIHFTFIDPFSNFLPLLKEEDYKCSEIVRQLVETQPLTRFSELDSNDVLFIDATHIYKEGNDVDFLIYKVLPNLKPGVIIHFHDIFWPLWKSSKHLEWNEGNIIKEFLEKNENFKILLFNDFLGKNYSSVIREIVPRFVENSGGSLWLRKER